MTKQFHDLVLGDPALDQLFREARSYNGWLDKDVTEEQIEAIYDLMKMGPTSANMQPARLVWCKSKEAKSKLAEFASDANKKKILTALDIPAPPRSSRHRRCSASPIFRMGR